MADKGFKTVEEQLDILPDLKIPDIPEHEKGTGYHSNAI